MSRFSYIKYDEVSVEIQQELKEAFEAVEKIVDCLADGRAKQLAYTKLEEAYMWTGKSVRDSQKLRNSETVEQPERNDE